MTTINSALSQAWQIHQKGEYQKAEGVYRQVIQAAPSHSAAWCYLGISLHDQRRYQEAVQAYERAIELQSQFPIAWNNLGNTLRYTGDIDRADSCFRKALEQNPNYVNAHKNRGTLHVWAGNLDRGLECYKAALQLAPQEAELHRNLGVLYLLQGKFEMGWPEYRWRWQTPDCKRPALSIPLWTGQPLSGKSILLHCEQGLGDTIHFVRYAEFLRQREAKTMVMCQDPLLAILQSCPGIDRLTSQSVGPTVPVDYMCSLVEAADYCGTNIDSIPANVPYIKPAANLVQYWKNRLDQQIPASARRIGIVWQGNRDHQADMFRSVPLKAFETLATLPSTTLISLQKGFGVEQIAKWRGTQPIYQLGDDVDKTSGAFVDTAAILQNLDLLITSDTSIAHLGGALGIPTWIVLNYVPDWRWLLGRDDSPWYPTVRLFRQSKTGDWEGTFARVKAALEGL